MKQTILLFLLVCALMGCALPGDEATPMTTDVATGATPAALVVETATLLPAATATAVAEPTATAAATFTPSPPATPTTPAPPTPTAGPFEPRVVVFAGNLEIPWELAFAPDGRIFVTERPGRLRVFVDGALQPEPLAVLTSGVAGEGGLMGLALDPALSQNGYLYVMYTYGEGNGPFNRISRLRVDGDRAGEERVLLDAIPGGRIHNGGRLAIGPDGKLYATTGDAGAPRLAQDLSSLAGKILRLNLDGSVPDDNPFPGSYVYSSGHRNPQGLAWHPVTGQLYSTEHGPSGEMGLCCRDELNLIIAGGNYGWPNVTLPAGDPRFIDPILDSGAQDTWAPAGAAIYPGGPLAPWEGSLFFGALRGQHLVRAILDPNGEAVVTSERLLEGEYGRIRVVTVGPDGALWLATSNRDGRGRPAADDDRILRIVP